MKTKWLSFQVIGSIPLCHIEELNKYASVHYLLCACLTYFQVFQIDIHGSITHLYAQHTLLQLSKMFCLWIDGVLTLNWLYIGFENKMCSKQYIAIEIVSEPTRKNVLLFGSNCLNTFYLSQRKQPQLEIF